MQLGARWRVGDEPHRGVPPVLYQAISEAEAEYPSSGSWTLTWLEGRAVVQLEQLLRLSVQPDNSVQLRELVGASGELTDIAPPASIEMIDDDDDDDWLQ